MPKTAALAALIDVANLDYTKDKVRCQGSCGQLRSVLYCTTGGKNICASCLSGRPSKKGK